MSVISRPFLWVPLRNVVGASKIHENHFFLVVYRYNSVLKVVQLYIGVSYWFLAAISVPTDIVKMSTSATDTIIMYRYIGTPLVFYTILSILRTFGGMSL